MRETSTATRDALITTAILLAFLMAAAVVCSALGFGLFLALQALTSSDAFSGLTAVIVSAVIFVVGVGGMMTAAEFGP